MSFTCLESGQSLFQHLSRETTPFEVCILVMHNLFQPGATFRLLKLLEGQTREKTKPLCNECMTEHFISKTCIVKKHRVNMKVCRERGSACFFITLLLVFQ